MMLKARVALSSPVSARVGPAAVTRRGCGVVARRQVLSTLPRAASEVSTSVETVTELLSMQDFDDAMSSAGDSLVVIDVSSSKCGPCKLVWPKFVALSEEFGEQAVFLKINGDTNKDTVAMMKEWQVRAVPEFRFYRNGEVIHKHTGADAEKLRNHIEEYL